MTKPTGTADPPDTLAGFEHELQSERAHALGLAGKKVEATLAALATDRSDDAVYEAAEAVWAYLIVREGLGMFDHDAALAIYGVPDRVRARIGVIRPVR